MFNIIKALWSYCTFCWTQQDFIIKNGQWVCGKCGHSLQKASVSGTKVTQLGSDHGYNY